MKRSGGDLRDLLSAFFDVVIGEERKGRDFAGVMAAGTSLEDEGAMCLVNVT